MSFAKGGKMSKKGVYEKYTEYTDEEILEIFKNEYERIKPKGLGEFEKKRQKDVPSLSYLLIRFKTTWNELKKKMRIEDIVIPFYTNKEIISEIKRIKKKVKHSPTISEFNNNSYMSESVLKRRFGSYDNALKKAGIKKLLIQNVVKKTDKHPKEYIKNALLKEKNKIGRRLTGKEIKENENLPALNTILQHFRSSSIANIWKKIE